MGGGGGVRIKKCVGQNTLPIGRSFGSSFGRIFQFSYWKQLCPNFGIKVNQLISENPTKKPIGYVM